MRRAFSPLTEKKSVAAYAIVELHFIRAMLQANQRTNKRKETAYQFNAKQKAALDNLEATLDGYNDDTKAEAETRLGKVFSEVYFPNEYEAETDFKMPSTVFLAIQKHLQDHNMSPFAALRDLLHRTSVVSKSTPRPDMIWWRGDTVTVGKISVDTLKYKEFLQTKLQETEKFVKQNILLGLFTLQELDKCCNLSELKDLSSRDNEEDVPGNGILLDIRDGNFDNEDSDQFFHKLLQHRKLDIKQDASGNLVFGRTTGMNWISDIDKALGDVQFLCHATQGPGVDQERTGGFRTGYHKGAFITGQHKEILRLLPYRVYRLLWILVRVIRPIELVVLFDLLIKHENRQAVILAYRQRIWVSYGRAWSPAQLSDNLKFCMERGMGAKMGARIYRHFSIAIQQHYPETNYGRFETTAAEQARFHSAVVDLMAGHIPDVADMNYARVQDILTKPGLKAAFVRVLKDWHKFLGFSTGPEA
ncbi:hypothetical protein HYPSUDRAFT_59206 [Hypholoma sublateritium FD-334 SS-4]|uniref:Uncharacterized protein n=1 Tax=Hypholoma sublateritium (strain FD-334 SS-4) TaxID=945553 RepID=A0A0D2N6L1_HYPSF|nr:hypothetical protein HYPSUDRAFT_59206 [Hypholoma sublateritium FD-334 SS-4]